MNQKDLMVKRNNVARLFKHSSKIHRNCVRLNPGNGLRHEEAKMQICWVLLNDGMEFITEAEFEDGSGRADIVNLDEGVCIEIVNSEGVKSINEKKKKYPLPIVIQRC